MTPESDRPAGPLAGVRLVEFAAIGPAPFGVMLLADLGADVLRIGRADAEWPDVPVVSRGRATLTLDLKNPLDSAFAGRIAGTADVLVEGFRPGVMERLGLGPDVLLERNTRLIYGRMTGWGQEGPIAGKAGHDINYIGLTGMLAMLARNGEPPVAPQNLLGDYGGGGLYLALGIIAALYERERSGKGQVVDAAIVDGAVSMLAPILGMARTGLVPRDPGQGMLAGNKLYYRTYRCADGRDFAVGPLEPRFRRQFAAIIGVDPEILDDEANAQQIERIFASRDRGEWAAVFAEADCCATPVLDMEEAPDHPHLMSRSVFLQGADGPQPAPAPRFSRTPGAIQPDGDGAERLRAWGIDLEEERA